MSHGPQRVDSVGVLNSHDQFAGVYMVVTETASYYLL